jgi:hypothetical protein
MAKRIAVIIVIYCCTAAGWLVLAGSMLARTHMQDQKLRSQVGQLWGAEQKQTAPLLYYETTTAPDHVDRNVVPLDASDVKVDLKLDYRQKGLLWYSTYRIGFRGTYRISNPTEEPRRMLFAFTFPSQAAVYDNFRLLVGGQDVQRSIRLEDGTATQAVTLQPHQATDVEVSYGSQGMDRWWYSFGDSVSQIRDFSLAIKTDFDRYDFPERSISPTAKRQVAGGWELKWSYSSLLTGVTIGLAMPQKLNPGPWAGEVTFAAPVSLFFFFFLLFIFTMLKKIRLHPMNYLFLAAAFFSFHLLLAYLVDHVSIHLAFLGCSLVSISLVVSYMRLVVGGRIAFVEIAIAQFIYLVVFSYTFFFEQYTGLAITALVISTLFVVMQVTARVDWERAFGRGPALQPISATSTCPYCREQMEPEMIRRCEKCGTLHHSSCWGEHGGCAIYGCGRELPPTRRGA